MFFFFHFYRQLKLLRFYNFLLLFTCDFLFLPFYFTQQKQIREHVAKKGNTFFDFFDERKIFIQKAVQRDRKYAFSWDHRYVGREEKKGRENINLLLKQM